MSGTFCVLMCILIYTREPGRDLSHVTLDTAQVLMGVVNSLERGRMRPSAQRSNLFC